MQTLWYDIRYAARSLRKAPGFALLAVLTLALGIGANTAIFTVIEGVLLRPLPFRDPGRLAVVRQRPVGQESTQFEVSYPAYRAWAEARSFEEIGAWPTSLGRFVFEADDGAVGQVHGSLVTWNLFRTLGARPELGRSFTAADDRVGAAPVAILGDALWRSRFGADPDVLGSQITLDGKRYTVVGVMPPGFVYPPSAQVWMPVVPAVGADMVENPGVGFLNVVGRLAPGVGLSAATEEMTAVANRVATQGPNAVPELRAELTPIREELLGDVRPALLILLAAAGLVLLIACANVANLLLVRGAARRRELALRTALGASRGTIVRQQLTEALLLAVAGAALGIALCAAGVRSLVALTPAGLYRADGIAVDPRVLAFAAAVAVVAAAVFGLVPALHGSIGRPVEALQAGSARRTRGPGGRRLAGGLVVLETALAVLLLAGAGLLLRSFLSLRSIDTGFDTESTLSLTVFLPDARYPTAEDVDRFYETLTERVRALPGVSAAAGVLIRPLDGPNGYDYPFTVEGQAQTQQEKNPLLEYEAVTPDYFRTLGIPLLRGRSFDERDRADAPGVVIVSRNVAERFWPGQDPVGRRLKWGPPDSPAPWLTVVGVAGDARYRSLTAKGPEVYVPYHQSPWHLNHLVVRAATNPAALVPAIRRELASLDPAVHAVDPATLHDMVSRNLTGPRFQTALLGLFAALALALGAVGIYGVTAQTTAQRTREMGIRMALGARAADVRRLVLREAMTATALGIGLGLVAALAAAGALAGLLHGVGERDPLTLGGVALLLAAVAAAAAYLPAVRATRADPASTLRE